MWKALVFKIIAIGLVIVGAYGLKNQLSIQKEWQKNTAKVALVTQSHYLIDFKTESGEFIKVRLKKNSEVFTYEKGDEMPIIYPQLQYNKAQANALSDIYLLPFFFMAFGAIVFLVMMKGDGNSEQQSEKYDTLMRKYGLK